MAPKKAMKKGLKKKAAKPVAAKPAPAAASQEPAAPAAESESPLKKELREFQASAAQRRAEESPEAAQQNEAAKNAMLAGQPQYCASIPLRVSVPLPYANVAEANLPLTVMCFNIMGAVSNEVDDLDGEFTGDDDTHLSSLIWRFLWDLRESGERGDWAGFFPGAAVPAESCADTVARRRFGTLIGIMGMLAREDFELCECDCSAEPEFIAFLDWLGRELKAVLGDDAALHAGMGQLEHDDLATIAALQGAGATKCGGWEKKAKWSLSEVEAECVLNGIAEATPKSVLLGWLWEMQGRFNGDFCVAFGEDAFGGGKDFGKTQAAMKRIINVIDRTEEGGKVKFSVAP